MKTSLTYLLICFSLALCGFIGFQWVREARLRDDVQKLTIESHGKTEAAANLEGTIKTLQNEIARLDALKAELTEDAKTNRQQVAQMRTELRKANGENETFIKQVETHQKALTQANENIRQQNEGIQKQNSELKLMVDQRNNAITKQNELIEQYNDLVKKFNELQEQLKVRNATAAQ
ncbi:MAG: hypothetical protein H0X66_11390 [Verrucomicrobia bacterium]|nr:hypothetical protein [Verrucomicrobiota bacterium]